jgi:hypothetical protein
MQQSIPAPADMAQVMIAKKVLDLENQIKSGISWFFWIAALSIINTILFQTGASFSFTVGLGITQFIDGVSVAVSRRGSSGTAVIVTTIALFLDVVIAGLFVLFGVFGRKRVRWLIIVGMVLYAADGVLCVVFEAWLTAAFHALALWGLFRGIRAINALIALEKSMSGGQMVAIQQLAAVQLPQAQADPAARKRFLRGVAIIFIPLLLILAVVFVLALANLL